MIGPTRAVVARAVVAWAVVVAPCPGCLHFIFKVLFFSFLAFSLRPQILPILFVWSSFALIKNKKVSFILVTLLGLIVSQIEYIKTEIFN